MTLIRLLLVSACEKTDEKREKIHKRRAEKRTSEERRGEGREGKRGGRDARNQREGNGEVIQDGERTPTRNT